MQEAVPPPIVFEPPPHPSYPNSSSSVHHISTGCSLLAFATNSVLTIATLPTPSLSPSHIKFLAQWPAPPQFQIADLTLTPDDKALALLIHHSEHLSDQSALVLLHPHTAQLLIRIIVPRTLSFPRTSPGRTLAFISPPTSLQPQPTPHCDVVPIPPASTLSPHLRHAFSNLASTVPNHSPSQPFLTNHHAKYALAVHAGADTLTIYIFNPTYNAILQTKSLDITVTNKQSPFSMHVIPVASSDILLLALLADSGVIFIEGAKVALHVPLLNFVPLAVTLLQRSADNSYSCALLATYSSARMPIHNQTSLPSTQPVVRVWYTPGKPLKTKPFYNIAASDLSTLSLIPHRTAPFSVMLADNGDVRFLHGDHLSVPSNNIHQITDPYADISIASADATIQFYSRESYLSVVIANGPNVLVTSLSLPTASQLHHN